VATRILTTLMLSEVYSGAWGALLLATYASPTALYLLGTGSWPLIPIALLTITVIYMGIRRFRRDPVLLLSLPITREELVRSEVSTVFIALLPLVLASHILWGWDSP